MANITEQDLTKEQKEAFDSIIKWTNNRYDNLLTLGGVAGSGKSVLISLIAKKLQHKSIAFCAYTGIAANVLRQKLYDTNVNTTYCGTIHGLMYIPIVDPKTLKVTGWKKKFKIDEELIIVDEGSMVDGKLFKDLQSYGKKILVVGDHKQLSPVGGNDVYLMKNPQLKLTEIHRVAQDNPIIQLSKLIRTGKGYSGFKCDNDKIQYVKYGSDKLDEIIYDSFKEPENRLDSALLCYYNKSRVKYNNVCRQIVGYENEMPTKDDVVICLKNTNINDSFYIFNGMRGLVEKNKSSDDMRYLMNVNFKDDDVNISELVSKYQFNQEKTFSSITDVKQYSPNISSWYKVGLLFDYGYCISYHKCLHPDTLVETPNGLCRINKLPPNGLIATPTGFAQYTNLVFNKEFDMLEIETKSGYKLRTTLDHGVDVWDNKLGYIKKEAKDITKNDIVRLKLGTSWNNQELVNLHNPIFENTKERIYDVPKYVDENFAEFLGIMVSGGTIFKTGFKIAKKCKEFADRFEELCLQLFDCKAVRVSSANVHQIIINSGYIKCWLECINGLQPVAKAIPNVILQSNLKIQAAFLKGMFEDGSVYIKNDKLDYIELYSSFHNIARDIKTMLLRFNIISDLVKTKHGYGIQIYGYNAKIFADKIGLISKSKKEKLSYPAGKETCYIVPITIDELMTAVDDNFKLNPHEKRCSITNKINRDLLKNVLQRCNTKNKMWHELNDRLNFHHDEVKIVTNYKGTSVCVEVPEGHQFIQDGFCGWNSQGSSFNTVILFAERSKYQDEEEYNRAIYTAVTRSSNKLIIVD